MTLTTNDAPACLCVGGIIIDDIVHPDGRTQMGVLGGAVSHAAAGMLGAARGHLACAGRDLPSCRRLARDSTRRLVVRDLPQARAWQLFEWDGRRTGVWRVDLLAPFVYGRSDQLPAVCRRGPSPAARRGPDSAWRALWQRRCCGAVAADHGAGLRLGVPPALASADIVSPNRLGALAGFDDPAALVRATAGRRRADRRAASQRTGRAWARGRRPAVAAARRAGGRSDRRGNTCAEPSSPVDGDGRSGEHPVTARSRRSPWK